MRAWARLEGPEGQVADLQPGDIIGRTHRSALRLDDPRISEAHALVSLRGGRLKLLALRGALAVGRQRLAELELAAGLTVHLAKGAAVHVLGVSLPPVLMAVAVGDAPPVALMGSVQSIGGSPVTLAAGYSDTAFAHVWSTGDAWMLRCRDQTPVLAEPGLGFDAGGTPVRLVELDLREVGASSTVDAGRLDAALHLVARYHSVHIHRQGHPVLSLSGQPAVLLSELVTLDGPVEWTVLAGQIWRRHSRRDGLRKKLDATLMRLRRKLSAAGIREDLVRADGTGRLELVLREGDRTEDLT
jgi:hypothetical protein